MIDRPQCARCGGSILRIDEVDHCMLCSFEPEVGYTDLIATAGAPILYGRGAPGRMRLSPLELAPIADSPSARTAISPSALPAIPWWAIRKFEAGRDEDLVVDFLRRFVRDNGEYFGTEAPRDLVWKWNRNLGPLVMVELITHVGCCLGGAVVRTMAGEILP